VTDIQAKRIAVLTAAAKAKSAAKTQAAEQGIRALVKRGQPITFQAVQREAGVSHAFLYNHPDLRGRIEHLRAKARPNTTPTAAPDPDNESAVVLALTAQIRELQRRHRHDVATLRDALEQAHGENLDLRRQLARRGTGIGHPTTHVASHPRTPPRRRRPWPATPPPASAGPPPGPAHPTTTRQPRPGRAARTRCLPGLP
jgi:hypothetical protein